MPEIYATPAQVAGAVHNVQRQIDALAGVTPVSAWEDVQKTVRDAIADKVFSIRDQFTMQRSNVNLTWDVIGIDHDTPTDSQFAHSMTLQLHDCFPTTMQFDAQEAFYYAENGLEARTYHFTIDSTDYQFTLPSSVNAGGQLMLAFTSSVPTAVTVAQTKGGAVDSDIGSLTVEAGSGGDSLGTLSNAVNGNLNSILRVKNGSNNYKESAIRQWLNSDKPAGQVWSPQTNFDRPPKWVTGEDNTAILDGFMYGMDADFLAAIGKTHIVAARNTVTDGGGYDEMDDYFFLPSRSEVYGGVEASGVNEGEPYPYYSHYSDLSAAGANTDSNRAKYNNSTAVSWLCRSPEYTHGTRVRYIHSSGGVLTIVAGHSGFGIAPACNII